MMVVELWIYCHRYHALSQHTFCNTFITVINIHVLVLNLVYTTGMSLHRDHAVVHYTGVNINTSGGSVTTLLFTQWQVGLNGCS